MKYIPGSLKTQLESSQFIPVFFIEVNIDGGPLKFTSWSLPIVKGGSTYRPRGMRIDAVPATTSKVVDTFSFTLDDVDRALLASLEGTAGFNSKVYLDYGVLDANYHLISSIVLFNGFIDRWEYSPGKCRIVASSIFVQWATITTAKVNGSCRWKVFKGADCKYTGSHKDCDRTYTTCSNYGNELNFGGFRWLPSMVAKSIDIK